MIIEGIEITCRDESFNCDFIEKNHIFNSKSIQGKTTLIRFIIYGLGFDIPITPGVDLSRHRDGFDARAYMFDNDWNWATYNPYIYSIVTEDEEPELDEKNDKLDGFLGEFIKEAV